MTGSTVYYDASLATPVTGYSYLTVIETGKIYTINSVTGVITGDTGLMCGAYNGTFRRGATDIDACAGAAIVRYVRIPGKRYSHARISINCLPNSKRSRSI